MVIKTRSGEQPEAKREFSKEDVQKLVVALADKPYGEKAQLPLPIRQPKPRPLTISLPDTMIERIEDAAMQNKRAGMRAKTVSAIVRGALEAAGYHA